jgi:hypothetical protein
VAPRIAWVEEDAATGRIAELYASVRDEDRHVADIVKTFSPRQEALEGMRSFGKIHLRPDAALSRAQREMIATHVSAVIGCHY